jgi:hypothetical protein
VGVWSGGRTSDGLRGGATDGLLSALQRQRESIRHRGLRYDIELQPQMNDGLGDLRADAADDTIGAHQSGSRYSFDEVLSYEGVMAPPTPPLPDEVYRNPGRGRVVHRGRRIIRSPWL